jgi:exonuclease VII large subunit
VSLKFRKLIIRSKVELEEELTFLKQLLAKSVALKNTAFRHQLEQFASAKIFKNIRLIYENYLQALDEKQLRFNSSANLQTEKIKANLELLAYKLESLNPQVQLERGYAIILDEAKNIVKSSQQKTGTPLTIKFSDGELKVRSE